MSTAAVTSSSIQPHQYFQQRDSELKQLGQALQSGNLAAATQAFNAIQNLGQTATGGNSFKVSQRQSDFEAVGQALQSGDLAGAQAAFQQLRSTVTNGRVQREADPPATVVNLGSGSGVDPALGSSSTISGAGASGTTNSTGEIVLNLGNLTPGETISIGVGTGSNGDEQLTIGVSGQSGQSAGQVTLDLGANSGQQIVLNLLSSAGATGTSTTGTGTTGTSTTSSTGASGVNVTA